MKRTLILPALCLLALTACSSTELIDQYCDLARINSGLAPYYYKKAAELGSGEAYYELGNIYAEGTIMPQDWAKAIEYYEDAESAFRSDDDYRYADVCYKLGQCYELGNGIDQDSTEAKLWYKKASEAPHTCRGKELAAQRLAELQG